MHIQTELISQTPTLSAIMHNNTEFQILMGTPEILIIYTL